jgi:hypothetical protein
MSKLVTIPLIEGSSIELLRRFPDRARALALAAENTFGLLSRVGSRIVMPLGDRISLAWLEKTANPYASEIKELAGYLGIRGVYFLNICFEWGCTSGVWETPTGPLLRRVLDWPFPELGEHIVVARQSGRAGPFLNITWPGISGTYHAIAPGRFVAAINQAPMRRHGRGYAVDWLNNRAAAGRARGLPASHLLRQVFENAASYDEARHLLCQTPLAVPAIFILSGTRSGEGCTIERTEDDFAVGEMENGRVCAANHFESVLNGTGRGWSARPIDSEGRAACARALSDVVDLSWFAPPIANINSRLVFEANAAAPSLALMGTAGIRPVTELFRLGQQAA